MLGPHQKLVLDRIQSPLPRQRSPDIFRKHRPTVQSRASLALNAPSIQFSVSMSTTLHTSSSLITGGIWPTSPAASWKNWFLDGVDLHLLGMSTTSDISRLHGQTTAFPGISSQQHLAEVFLLDTAGLRYHHEQLQAPGSCFLFLTQPYYESLTNITCLVQPGDFECTLHPHPHVIC
jgi:hypothetical protein